MARWLLLVALCVLATSAFIHARAANTQPPTSDIVVDETTGAVRVLVAGKEIAVFDHNGLRVNGDLLYRGTMTDIGAEADDAP